MMAGTVELDQDPPPRNREVDAQSNSMPHGRMAPLLHEVQAVLLQDFTHFPLSAACAARRAPNAPQVMSWPLHKFSMGRALDSDRFVPGQVVGLGVVEEVPVNRRRCRYELIERLPRRSSAASTSATVEVHRCQLCEDPVFGADDVHLRVGVGVSDIRVAVPVAMNGARLSYEAVSVSWLNPRTNRAPSPLEVIVRELIERSVVATDDANLLFRVPVFTQGVVVAVAVGSPRLVLELLLGLAVSRRGTFDSTGGAPWRCVPVWFEGDCAKTPCSRQPISTGIADPS